MAFDENVLHRMVSLAVSQGADYADIRYETSMSESAGAEDGKPKDAGMHVDEGFGIRARIGGAWGFASVSTAGDLPVSRLNSAVSSAVAAARASSKYSKKLEMAPMPASGKYITKVRTDPFKVSLDEKMALCVEASKRMSSTKGIAMSAASIGCERIKKWFVSSEGSSILQDQTFILGGLFALAKDGPVTDFYMTTEGGQRGFEALSTEYDFVSESDGIAAKANEIVHAASPKPKETTVVVDPDAMALVVHEIAGHPVEADRVLGWEAAWAGTSWWADMQGKQIGSENVTIVSDASIPGYLGSYGFDDEGIPARRVVHMEKGVLKDFLHSRETGAITKSKPGGAMRAVGFQFAPIIRMTNTYMENGDWKAEEIIEDTKDGVYLCGHHTPSIDAKRYNFQIRVKTAYEIKNGEIGKPLRAVSLGGTSDRFWSSIDAAGDDLVMRPVPNCGKGDPMQTCMVGNGGPTVRAKARISGVSAGN